MEKMGITGNRRESERITDTPVSSVGLLSCSIHEPSLPMRRGRACVMGNKTSEAPGLKADRGRRRWHFAGAVLDERTLELLVNGVNAGLERKPLEVLIFLLERSDEVCTKDELLAGVWPGRILSETVLTKGIVRLPEALADQDQTMKK